jgi:hypothetical protein
LRRASACVRSSIATSTRRLDSVERRFLYCSCQESQSFLTLTRSRHVHARGTPRR